MIDGNNCHVVIFFRIFDEFLSKIFHCQKLVFFRIRHFPVQKIKSSIKMFYLSLE